MGRLTRSEEVVLEADANVVEMAVVGFGEVTIDVGKIELVRTVAAPAVFGRLTDVLLLVSSERSLRFKSVSEGNVLSGGGTAVSERPIRCSTF